MIGRRRDAAPEAVVRTTAAERASALAEALTIGGAELEGDAARGAYSTITKVRERTALTGDHTVVAVAGATGSGKSSLFNRLVGADVSTVAARRPTTATAVAATYGPSATPLLDWLGVGRRHEVADDPDLDGLVLLDLPDFDSHAAANRAEADRVLALADVFCWVTDPQKYADSRWHDEYLTRYADHDAVMVVVLNQADRLTPAAQESCLADLRGLLAREGLGSVQVIAASAVTGQGIDELRAVLHDNVAAATAVQERLLADLRHDGTALRPLVGDDEADLPDGPPAPLVHALSRAAGVPIVLEAIERDYQRESAAHTGWPFTRWSGRLSADPLRRYRLKGAQDHGITVTDVRKTVGRSSLPPPTPAARSAVELETRRLADEAAAGLPPRWADAVHEAASPARTDLVDSLDQAVLAVPLRARRPKWWGVVNALQWLLAACAVVGFAWLLGLQVLRWAALPEPPLPRQGIFPWPLILLVLGLLLGLALAAVSAAIARGGAARRREGIGRRFDAAIADVADDRLMAPVRAVLERHRQTRHRIDEVLR